MSLHSFLRRIAGLSPPAPDDYAKKLAQEIAAFQSCVDVHALPAIYHYWSNTYLRPKFESLGFSSPDDFFLRYLEKTCRATAGPKRIVSLGAGNCDTEVRVAAALRERGLADFTIECVEINAAMLERGTQDAREKGVSANIRAVRGDFNKWSAEGPCHAVMANQSLHHVQNLEGLFDAVARAIGSGGTFLVSDMIGRNGHQRWPEALAIVREFWKELPPRHRYNLQLRRQEDEFLDWDCSSEGFEGIRAQEVLPLLVERFTFDLFAPFANVIDPFIDRGFGHHFDAQGEWDRAFIDRVHARDDAAIRSGVIKPTHVVAVLAAGRPGEQVFLDGLAPRSCIRTP
jgi:SAM-dependent methyltransferase